MISIVILTRNEAKTIGHCLESLKNYFDDIHIIDCGSQDETCAIAQSYKATVHTKTFVSFADQHNWAHTHAGLKYEWVLHLDADEQVTEAFVDNMREAIGSASDTIEGFYCCWKLILEDRWLKFSDCFPRWQLRLIRKKTVPYIDFGHAQKENTFEDKQLSYIKEPYLHYPWLNGWEHWLEKHNRYSTNEAKERLSYPWSWRLLFSQHGSKRVLALKVAVSRLFLWPLIRFIYMYGVRGGFLDGFPGLIYCTEMMHYEWMIQIKMRSFKKENNLEKDYRWKP